MVAPFVRCSYLKKEYKESNAPAARICYKRQVRLKKLKGDRNLVEELTRFTFCTFSNRL